MVVGGLALMQLVSIGGEDIYLTGNPDYSYFKSAYVRHTKSSHEYIFIQPDKIPTYSPYSQTTINFKLERIGDLVQETYLVLDLPKIYGSELSLFQWVPYLGYNIINKVKFLLGGTLIDQQYGEYMAIIGDLKTPPNKRDIYDELIGNSPDFQIYPRINFSNDYNTYNHDELLYVGKRLYIPLTLWFNKSSNQSLPLCCLQKQDAIIQLELAPVINWFLIGTGGWSTTEFFSAPNESLTDGDLAFREQMTAQGYDAYSLFFYFMTPGISLNVSSSTDSFNTQMMIKYIYLDSDEQRFLVTKPQKYLITQVQKFNFSGLNVGQNTVQIYLNNPVKEFIFMFSKQGVNGTNNNFFNYSQVIKPNVYNYFKNAVDNNILNINKIFDLEALKSGIISMSAFNFSKNFLETNFVQNLDNIFNKSYPTIVNNKENLSDSFDNILQKCKILFNGQIRLDYKDKNFFEGLEQFKFHTNNCRINHVYLYNFGLDADSVKPNGSCNFSGINKFQMEFYLKDNMNISNIDNNYGLQSLYQLVAENKDPDDFDTNISNVEFLNINGPYEMSFYAISYNIIEFKNGFGDVLFSV